MTQLHLASQEDTNKTRDSARISHVSAVRLK
jgi:hypothetical protein